MYVKVAQHMTRPAEMTHDKRGEPVLMLQFGLIVDFHLARIVETLLSDLTTYEAARAQWMKAPLTYDQAAKALGVGRKFLVRRVSDDPTFPHSALGSHIRFYGQDIEEIKQRFARGELRYNAEGGRPWRGPSA